MNTINLKSLIDTIRYSKNKRVMITFHSVGDTDSVSSAFALFEYFDDATIAAPDIITSNSRRIIEKLGFKNSAIKTKFDKDAELVILVDVNNFVDCGRFKEELEKFKGAILIIDHHTPNKMSKGNVVAFNDESYNSAASIVYDVLKAVGFNVQKNLANLIATGILSDSAELRNAFPKTFIQIGELLEKAKIDYQSILLEMQHIATIENRAEFINDLFNAQVIMMGKLLMVYGKATIHANKVADDAIKIGADVSLFYSESDKEISFSARLRPPLDKVRKINLGRIMKELAPLLNGQGGGHPCAAGAYGPNSTNQKRFADEFIDRLKSAPS